jgi:hypothetical protein
MLDAMSCRRQSRRLYIADLARRQYEMELGHVAMQPLAYRVLSKRLREALAGLPEPIGHAGFPELPAHLMPLLREMLERRHFDQHRCLLGAWAADSRRHADTLFDRLKRPAHR